MKRKIILIVAGLVISTIGFTSAKGNGTHSVMINPLEDATKVVDETKQTKDESVLKDESKTGENEEKVVTGANIVGVAESSKEVEKEQSVVVSETSKQSVAQSSKPTTSKQETNTQSNNSSNNNSTSNSSSTVKQEESKPVESKPVNPPESKPVETKPEVSVPVEQPKNYNTGNCGVLYDSEALANQAAEEKFNDFSDPSRYVSSYMVYSTYDKWTINYYYTYW